MKFIADNPIIRCTSCHGWEGPVKDLHMSLLGKNPEAHAFFSCALCNVVLVEREHGEYILLDKAKMVKMTVEALTDLDLAKLLLRGIEISHHKKGESGGMTDENLRLEHALDLMRFPSGFDLNSFTGPELLGEKLRRKPQIGVPRLPRLQARQTA